MGFRLNRAILWYNSQHVFFKDIQKHFKPLTLNQELMARTKIISR